MIRDDLYELRNALIKIETQSKFVNTYVNRQINMIDMLLKISNFSESFELTDIDLN